MKMFMSFMGALLLSTLLFTSCSKDKDPADTDIFAGTFKGKIGYTDSDQNISKDNGSVFVTKVGTRYDFRFSDGIPDLTGVEFEKKDDNTMVSIGSSGTGLITINKDRLVIGFTRDNKAWSADCTR
ncbi:hypothetical protein SAMN05660909_04607 [Chitinophaga terrae (ex Kim and Jung 2007)]|jgi:hypothetical protein|uniref:Lipoprotein n=1 Tax=Chitinophaga terrae (ex Kim and Jung 2007) TaxID=408074 RepID=A0A1H4FQ85_9BACT|nr:hypothetical protein [Chitinophaga terrae (ex Kim and Jung 2007)]MDQ0109643.1 hypothetical protein [Chitinophaga terrae (ex Kim and Jung 2007)]GEP92662.1 hypothetical protein CTE07_43070 [Chitinophaga terrae (ex Kim and Jung 2007)]SEA99496.1 hypothetical protein SAMN05660909_04607 [Chitinophaga terrae (ex Kim and Jung 2007)]